MRVVSGEGTCSAEGDLTERDEKRAWGYLDIRGRSTEPDDHCSKAKVSARCKPLRWGSPHGFFNGLRGERRSAVPPEHTSTSTAEVQRMVDGLWRVGCSANEFLRDLRNDTTEAFPSPCRCDGMRCRRERTARLGGARVRYQ